MNIVIRIGKASDIEVICYNEQKSYIHPWSNKMLQESINGKYDCFVMLLNDIVIGHLICQKILDEIHLYNVCVLPKYQGKGLGQRWLEHLEQYSNGENAKFILLEVRESNIKAKSLYEKMSYREIGYRKNYYKTSSGFENAIVMKALL